MLKFGLLLALCTATSAQAAGPVDPYLATALQVARSGGTSKTTALSIGAWVERRGRHVYVRDFYHGSPAAKAGLKRGDQILAVDGKGAQILDALLQLPHGRTVTLQYKRLPWSSPAEARVQPVAENMQQAWLDSTRESVAWHHLGEKELAYFRIWAVTDERMVSTAVSTFDSLLRKKPAAIIVDLRGPMPYDEPQLCKSFTAAFKQRPSKLVVMTDRHSGTCRLQLAATWRAKWDAKIVGEKGVVTPDIAAKDQLLFAAGHDPLMRRAQDFAAEWLQR